MPYRETGETVLLANRIGVEKLPSFFHSQLLNITSNCKKKEKADTCLHERDEYCHVFEFHECLHIRLTTN